MFSKGKQVPHYISIPVIVMFLVFSNIISCNDYEEWIRMNIPKEQFAGRLLGKYRDKNDRDAAVIQLEGKSHIIIYSYQLYEFIEIGDSIIKNYGTLKYIVKRNDSLFEFYPDSHGRLIKDA